MFAELKKFKDTKFKQPVNLTKQEIVLYDKIVGEENDLSKKIWNYVMKGDFDQNLFNPKLKTDAQYQSLRESSRKLAEKREELVNIGLERCRFPEGRLSITEIRIPTLEEVCDIYKRLPDTDHETTFVLINTLLSPDSQVMLMTNKWAFKKPICYPIFSGVPLRPLIRFRNTTAKQFKTGDIFPLANYYWTVTGEDTALCNSVIQCLYCDPAVFCLKFQLPYHKDSIDWSFTQLSPFSKKDCIDELGQYPMELSKKIFEISGAFYLLEDNAIKYNALSGERKNTFPTDKRIADIYFRN